MSRRKSSPAQTVVTPSIDIPEIAHPKPKRLRSPANLKLIKSLPCFCCDAPPPSDPDHAKSRGAFGSDELNNLNALCRSCHILRHSMGFKRFWDAYSGRIMIAREKYELPPLNIANITN
jgi:hypothetical protein